MRRHRSGTSVVPTTLALLALPLSAVGQQEVRPEPVAVFPEQFSALVGLRELSDGRVLVADRLEQHVSFLDFSSGGIQQVGREGQGPGEYSSPLGLLPLPDDGTLLVDIGNMRLTRVDRTGAMGESTNMLSGAGSFLMPSGTDDRGRVYHAPSGRVRVSRGGVQGAAADSAPVVAVQLDDDRADTVAMLKVPDPGAARTVRMSGGGGSIQMAGLLRPFEARDSWGVASDGSVAVVRTSPYRVDWYRDGRVHRGEPVEYRPIRIDRAEKEAWADASAQQTMTMRIPGGGGQTMSVPRPDIDEVDFPETKPPFGRDAVRIAPDGTVWVERSLPHDSRTVLYDVFDGTGRLVRRVRLGARREILGFGADSFYVAATDDDDLEWLEKYRR